MKSLNTMKFVANTIKELKEYEEVLNKAETYEEAANIARKMIGYIDCMITFNNTMICMENNDFTGEFDEVITEAHAHVYQLLVNKAEKTNQDKDLIWKLLKRRDEVAA